MSVGAVGCSKCEGSSQAWRDQLLAKGDKNDDGKLSLLELTDLTKAKERLNGKQASDGANVSASANRRDASTLLAALDTDDNGLLSKSELETRPDATHSAVADAVKQHKAGHSEHLRDLVFSQAKECKEDAGTCTDTNAQRLQQWMLEAFSSQFNVSNALGQGS